MHAREGERAIEKGVVRRDDDLVRGYPPARRLDDAVLVGVDLHRTRVLEDAAAIAGAQSLGQRKQVLARVELGLFVEAHRSLDVVWQRRVLDQRGRQPRLLRRRGLVLDLRAPAGGSDVRVRGLTPKVAVNLVALDAFCDPRQRRLVGLPISACAVGAEVRAQLVVDQPVLGGDLGGRVATDAASDLVGLQQHDAHARLGEQQRRRQPDDATAKHGDVGAQVVLEPRQLRLLGTGLDPDRRVLRGYDAHAKDGAWPRPSSASTPSPFSGARRSASSSRRINDSALRPIVSRWTKGLKVSHEVSPSGSSVMRTTVPPSLGVSSIVTLTVPAGRALARIRSRPGRLASSDSVWSLTLKGPRPTVWWNFEPGCGQSGSASRIVFEPTTQ